MGAFLLVLIPIVVIDVAWYARNADHIGLRDCDWTTVKDFRSAGAMLATVNLLCVDAAVYSQSKLEETARHEGVKVRLLLDSTVTDKWRLILLGIRPAK